MRLRRSFISLLCSGSVLAGMASVLPTSPAAALSPDVVISQVYGGGGNAGAFYRYDFIELYNRGAAPVQLAGWTVNYASSTGNFGGAGLNTTLAGFINPGEYYLVQQASGANTAAANLPTPDAIGTIAMSGTAAKVALAAPGVTCAGTTCPGNTDLVGFGAANGFETAPVAALTNTTAARRLGAPRGTMETDNNSTDFATGAPTPVSTGRGFFSCTTGTISIASVQGAGATSPCSGQIVTVTGLVTGWDDKRGQSAACALFAEDAGIWIQTPDATNDGNPATSDGIFVGKVFPRTSYPLGTAVQVTGIVEEKFGLTQITSASLTPTVVSSGNPLPTPVVIDAATAQAQNLTTKPYYESLEGMRVTASGIANSGGTNRFGELFLEPGTGPIDTLLRTSSTARQAALLGTADDAGAGDPAIPRTNPPSTTDVLADKGDTITGLTGPLTFSFSNYKVVPQIAALPTITKTGVTYPYDRLVTAPAGAVRIASFNMENYFPVGGTLDCTTVSAAENVDKTARLSDAVGRLLKAPDVLAVQEVVDLPTLQQLATKLGTDGYGTYTAYLVEGNDNRGIDVGFLAKNTVTVVSVTQFGKTAPEPAPAVNCTSDVPGLLFDRPPLVLQFTSPNLVGTHAVISNHFASKGNPDEQCRAKQAAFNRDIAATLRTAGTKVIVTGDINAFEDEPALTTLTAPGTNLTNLWSTAPADQRYSFQFNGLLQTLDHMVVDDGVLTSVVGFQYGHFDADYSYRSTAGDGHHVSDHSPPVLTLMNNPTPVVPEAPFAALLPLGALLLLGGALVLRRRSAGLAVG